METTFQYLRAHAVELGSRILETYPPVQSTKGPLDPSIATLLTGPGACHHWDCQVYPQGKGGEGRCLRR